MIFLNGNQNAIQGEKMKIIIDADACPVVDITVNTAKDKGLACIIVCDNTHSIEKDGAETV